MHRKQATEFVKDLAEKKRLDEQSADVLKMDPLVQIKCSTAHKGQLVDLIADLDAAAAEKNAKQPSR